MASPTISANHTGKTAQQVSGDPTHLLTSPNGTSVTVVVGRDGCPNIKVTGSSNADCILQYEAYMNIRVHDGKTVIR